jgi:hypothetical protein
MVQYLIDQIKITALLLLFNNNLVIVNWLSFEWID